MKAEHILKNGNRTITISHDEQAEKHLRELLRKAVNREKAPAALREKIRRMIREK